MNHPKVSSPSTATRTNKESSSRKPCPPTTLCQNPTELLKHLILANLGSWVKIAAKVAQEVQLGPEYLRTYFGEIDNGNQEIVRKSDTNK